MFCTTCGRELPDGAKFCTNCGAPVAKIVTREEREAVPVEDAGVDEAVAEPKAASELEPADEAAPMMQEDSGEAPDEESCDQPEVHEDSAQAAAADDASNDAESASADAGETTVMQSDSGETTVLSDGTDETTAVPSDSGETTVLPDGADETTVMQNDTGETTVLPDGTDETTVMPEHAETTVLPAAETEVIADAERAEAAADAAAAERALWSASEDAADAGTTETTVLEPAHMASDEAGQDGRQPAPEAPRKKRPTALIATIALLVVAAGAFFGIFVLPRIMGKDVPTVTYGQTDPVQCSVVTRVRPRDESGGELTSYVVYLMRQASDDAASSSSASEELNQVVAEIRVTGNNGFTMENFGEVPDGDYVLVIVPDDSQGESSSSSSNDEQRIPVHYEEDNPKAEEEVVVEPPAPEPSSPEEPAAEEEEFTDEEIASALFYYTCQDLIDEYGEPEAIELHDGMELAANGLALVKLLDFDGDGMNELLTVVGDASGLETMSFDTDAYTIAVWKYTDEAVEQVYEGHPPYSNGGYFYQGLYALPQEGGEDQILLESISFGDPTAAADTNSEITYTGYYGMGEQSFELYALRTDTFSYDDGSLETTFQIAGEEVSEDEWVGFQDSLTQTASYEFSCPVSNEPQAQSEEESEFEIIETAGLPDYTEGTIGALEAAAGDEALEAFAPEEDAEEDPAEATYTYVNSEADVTFTTSQGEGTDWEETRSWTYPQFALEDGSTTEALDALNASLKQSYEDDLAVTQAWTIDSGEAQVWVHCDEVTYLEGNIACVRSERYVFLGGAHGEESISGAFYDLSSGEELRVDEALGISWEDLQVESVDAIKAYLAENPNLTGADDTSLEGMAADSSRYFATSDGVAIAIMPYEVGPYSEGMQLVYVHAFEDPSLVGTSAAA